MQLTPVSSDRANIRSIVSIFLDLRESNAQIRNSVSRGIVEESESQAYPYVLPLLGDQALRKDGELSDWAIGIVRGLALTVRHRKIPMPSSDEDMFNGNVGKSLARISTQLSGGTIDSDQPDLIANRLASLEFQSINEAALSIDRILTLAESKEVPIPLDYSTLVAILARWGRGITPESIAVRRRLLREYYSALYPTHDKS